ncbi:FAD-dependent oxidoreductase [Cytobacillus firmus]|uniref:FAD-dependent oxidoreductase n=1 Tax=Cytobacillus firmus TaxID=1399 RepID=UPI0015810C34|nr:FAD-dependent oxidoreductase [Cytobacillus firmus]MBG9548160.1 glutamate synthase [Cytobacillus firmus]MBG9601673.1 glutamate synthase [Cytobacillus firmus]MDD9311708.1 FAD-dependent oxidoreductase [Cytobacillus firmus]MED1939529.1 FAD-dependent oxidoreductase [Cytobacillus firmus]NUH84502.1 FAD-dependent oxidoreductase [Cytobacillus firmus]
MTNQNDLVIGCCTPKKNEIEKSSQNNGKARALPVAIIGAGPVGLAAAAHLASRGQSFILLEAGKQAGANIKSWGHIRLFSPWRYNIDKAAASLLSANGWVQPQMEALPTGEELVEHYLKPLSSLPEIKPFIHLNTKVLSVGRKDTDKMKTANRDEIPFVIHAEQNGEYKTFESRAVIDAAGTWGNPNPASSSGIWLADERELKEKIFYGIPDVLGSEQQRYRNKRVAVVGGGHSAINALLDLAALKESCPETEILWIMRRNQVEDAYGGEEKDALEARGRLGSKIHQLVDNGQVEAFTPFRIQLVKESETGIELIGSQNGKQISLDGIDEMIVNTGNRPDFSIISELRTSIDSATESAGSLAPLIDPNIHSCGTVRPHGEKELSQPEKNFYIVGSKSYGRAPTFLMATGYEQVRSVAAYLSGDFAAAEKVELDLPETGVCSVNLKSSIEEPASSCCN